MGACSLEEIDHNFLRADFGIFMGRRRDPLDAYLESVPARL